MDQRIIDLYDDFTHHHLNRRLFMERLTKLAGGTAAALALVPLLENNKAQAAIVAPDDARLKIERITYPGATGAVGAYIARPANAGKTAGVIVIHENRGLVPHIQDVARRMALEGFTALAPDMLSPLGGTPTDEDKGREMFAKLDAKATVDNLVRAVAYLKGRADATGKVGCTGFCWGGGMTNQLAVAAPDLAAAVPYYGRVPEPAQVPSIKAALLLQYAGEDANINPGIPSYEAALKAAGKTYTIHIYAGAQHAFNNDTGAARYNEAAAKLAWERTIAFFKANLG
jgi:carboxymethylenebutenolidase